MESIRIIAARENRTPEEVADHIIVSVIKGQQEQEAYYYRWETLTRREQEVTALICLHYNTDEIAEKLSIARPTVKTHVAHILEKFYVPDRNGLRMVLKDWDFRAYDR